MVFEVSLENNYDSKIYPYSSDSFHHSLGTNILIIDNNLFTSTFLENWLTWIGCNVFIVNSGLEGMELLKSIPNFISLLVINLFNSEIDQLTIYSIFKTINPDIKTIMLVDATTDVNFFSSLEIEVLMKKPIDLYELDHNLKNILH